MPNADAWIVREIFAAYAAGESLGQIARRLGEAGARRMRSGNPFTPSSLLAVLRNEAYCGDRLFWKTPRRDYLSKRPLPAEAREEPRWFRNSHEPLVSREVWTRAQQRLEREAESRESGLRPRASSHFLYGKVFCGVCGEPFRRCAARGTAAWRCRSRDGKKEASCRGPQIREEALLRAAAEALGVPELTPEAAERIRRIRILDGKAEVHLSAE